MATTNQIKRKHNVLSLEKKLEIIKRLESGETGSVLAKIFNVGKATISDIKNKKELILSFVSKCDNQNVSKKRKVMKKPKNEKLEEAIYWWYVQRRSKGAPISGPLLCKKALELNNKLGGSPDFKASSGWLKNFKSRRGIREFEVQGESSSNNASAAENFRKTFLDFLKREGYSLDAVYNANETGLNWKSLPWKSLSSNRETSSSGFELSKERVTIMVCSNATGTHSLPLLMIGKLQNPRCFNNIKTLPLQYKSQKSACMNSEIFFNWFTDNFIPSVKKFREEQQKAGKVILLLDNAPSHPSVETLNDVDENFKVVYLPLNVSFLIQPMDQGVTEKLKRVYKKQVLRRLLLAEDEETAVIFSKNLNLKECCYMLADSWTMLTQDDIKKAWNKLLGKGKQNEETVIDYNEDLNEIENLLQEIPGFSECERNDAEIWLWSDDDPGFEILSNDQLLSAVKDEDQVLSEDDEDGPEETKNVPTHDAAFMALETALAWYEQQDESSPTQLLLMKRIKDLAAKKRMYVHRSM